MVKPVSYPQWALAPYCIGLKLRALRTQKRLTLARLAAETGLSTALLSKLETNRMIPTLPTLATNSRVYGVGMSHFFAELSAEAGPADGLAADDPSAPPAPIDDAPLARDWGALSEDSRREVREFVAFKRMQAEKTRADGPDGDGDD